MAPSTIRQRKGNAIKSSNINDETTNGEKYQPRQQQDESPANDAPLPPSLSSLSNASSSTTPASTTTTNSSPSMVPADLSPHYYDKRTMTPFQEKINALTILPSAVLSIYYISSGKWLLQESIQRAEDFLLNFNQESRMHLSQHFKCWKNPLLPHLHHMPPLTIWAIVLGILLHAPCSFLYHWKYAAAPHLNHNPVARIQHWSRRLDHSAIHMCSIFWSYATSAGHLPFFALNLVYNIDSIRYHWQPEIRPRRNQLRILGSMLLYTSPLLWRTDEEDGGGSRQPLRFQLFGKIWVIFCVALWLFAAYPLRGWSHAAFHMVMVAVPPLLWEMVAHDEVYGDWSMAAAHCAVLRRRPQ